MANDTTTAVSFAEYHRAFHVYAYENALSANARALFGYIAGELNARYWKTAELSKSVRDVRVECGFKSESTVQRAKSELCTESIVTVRKRKNVDIYKLNPPNLWRLARSDADIGTRLEHDWNTSGTLLEQKRNSSGTVSAPSNYAHAKDVEDVEDVKTFSTTTTTNARANPKNRVTADLDRELEQKLDAAVRELDKDVRAAWIEAKAENPFGGDLLDLIDLQKRYGAKALAETITYCRRNRQPNQWGGSGEVNINYVQRVLAKGSDKRGNVIKFPASTGTNPEPDIWDAKQSQLPF